MSNEDFATELGSILSNNKDEIISSILDLVRKKLEEEQPTTATEITREIENSGLIHRAILNWMNQWIAKERLASLVK